MVKRISRRQFLVWGTIGAASLLVPDLSACSPNKPVSEISASPTLPAPASPTPTLHPPASPTPTAPPSIIPTRCGLSPLVAPTRPADTPGYTRLDPATDLHMTGTPVDIDITGYRLVVTGKVDHPLVLSMDELRCMPKVTTNTTSICTGNFEDQATWAGVPIAHVLDLAGVQPGASKFTLTGADGYTLIKLDLAMVKPNAYLAYEWEGQPIPVLHGFPLRVIFDSTVGGYRVKWLMGIEVS